jgi:farnesyl-diphosphate farnesyltransferase
MLAVDLEPTVFDAQRTTRLMLGRVSRTFSVGIKLLPPKLEVAVRIGYLLCRIADTIEDDVRMPAARKAVLLDRFVVCFGDGAAAAGEFRSCTAELTGNKADVDLVAITETVFLIWRVLDADSRDIIERWVTEMAHGMRRFVLKYPGGIRIGTTPELREYCYFVAGTVGHLLTELWRVHSVFVGKRTYERLLRDCEAFGEALQLVNILKDIAPDAQQENAIYIPAELLVARGSSHETILADAHRAMNRAALMPLMAIAQDDIERSLSYIEALPGAAFRVRLFCVLPVLFAAATMRELEQTDAMLVPGCTVKIAREEVHALVVAGSASMLTNLTLHRLVERVRQRPFSLNFH